MGDIWNGIKLGFSPLSILTVFISLAISGVAFLISVVVFSLFAFLGLPGLIIGGLIAAVLLLVALPFASGLVSIASVQNMNNGKIDLGNVFSASISRLGKMIVGNLIVLIVILAVLFVFGIVGAIVGFVVGGSVASGIANTAASGYGANPFAFTGLLGGLGGLFFSLIFAYIGFYILLLAFFPFFISYPYFLANETGGAVDALKKARSFSMNMWPKSFCLIVGTIYGGLLLFIPLIILAFILMAVFAPLGLLLMGLFYLIYLSIIPYAGARIYLDSKQMANESVEMKETQRPVSQETKTSFADRREERSFSMKTDAFKNSSASDSSKISSVAVSVE